MSEVTIRIKDNGPLLVTGPIRLLDDDGNAYDLQGKETIALCRCGVSKVPPFCDGAHKECNFQSAERAQAQ